MQTITRKELISLLQISKSSIRNYERMKLLERVQYRPAAYKWEKDDILRLYKHFMRVRYLVGRDFLNLVESEKA